MLQMPSESNVSKVNIVFIEIYGKVSSCWRIYSGVQLFTFRVDNKEYWRAKKTGLQIIWNIE